MTYDELEKEPYGTTRRNFFPDEGCSKRDGGPATMKRHPIQPLEPRADGVVRFKENAIVRHLLDAGPFDMNQLALMDFTREDREQFAQLIGYSLSGFGELSYVSDETYEAAARMAEHGEDTVAARLEVVTAKLENLRRDLREPIADLYSIHPDDLMKE